eukprot:2923691-Alexandrium_andersonii.AAC.1
MLEAASRLVRLLLGGPARAARVARQRAAPRPAGGQRLWRGAHFVVVRLGKLLVGCFQVARLHFGPAALHSPYCG